MNPEFAGMFFSKMVLLVNLLLFSSILAVNFLKHFGTMLDMNNQLILIKSNETSQLLNK